MSYIVRSGNLTAAPELRHDSQSGRAYCFARVAVNDRAKGEDGEWRTVGTTFYSLTVRGSQATNLVSTASREGNIRILFAGLYRAQEYTRQDGTKGVSHNVLAHDVAVSLLGQTVIVDNTQGDPHVEDDYWRSLANS